MSERLVVTNARILTPDGVVDGGILVESGRIAARLAPGDRLPDGSRTLDGRGQLLAPGFFDLQLNGGFGRDFTAEPETIWEVAARLPQFGVTTFLPTIITSPPETIRRAQAVLAAGPPAGFAGAEPLGLHLEGPFLNPAKKGAHNPAYLRSPDAAQVAGWSPARGVRLVTLAPELPGGPPLIAHLAAQGVVVSAGHSLATAEEAAAAFEAGIGYGTHLFNAMPPLHHRAPGLAGALLADPRPVLGLIADGIHVHPDLLRLVWAAAGGRLNLVTDAMAAMGLGDGRYLLGDHEVLVQNGRAALADGTLAGSTVTLDRSLRLMARVTGAPLAEIIATITAVPARLLGLADQGQITPGAAADLVLLAADGHVALTIKSGRIVFDQEG